MASVKIPFGGGEVTVDVPDFAMEGTQQDVLEQASRQTDALQKIAQSMGISIQNDRQETKSNKDLTSAIKKGNSDEDKNFARLHKNLKSMNAMSGMSALNRSSGSETLSGLAGKDGILGAMGLAAMGGQIGTLFGIMEEFGSALGALRRTGGGLGADLLQLRTAASEVGLDMQTLAKITVENGNAIRSLGMNSADGTNEFLSLNKMLRESTRDMGFFGMGTKEMSNLLVDEIELRRSTRNESFLEAGARDQMVASMRENLKLNEVMASLTGQDVQDRIKARNEFRKNAIVAAAQSQMNQEQLDSQNALVENLSGLGSIGAAGGPIQSALTNLIAGVPMDKFNTSFTQLAAAASGEGIDLRANLEEFSNMVKAGADPEDMKIASQELIQKFANLEVPDGLLSRAGAGQEGAMLLLTARQEAFAIKVGEGSTVQQTVNETMSDFEADVAAGGAALSGMASQIQVAATELQNTIMGSTLKAFNVDVNNPDGLMGFINKLERLPSSDVFVGATNFIAEVATLASGAQGLISMVGIGNEGKGDPEKYAEQALLFRAVADAAGVPIAQIAEQLAPMAGKFGGVLKNLDAILVGGAMMTGIAGAYDRNKPFHVVLVGDETQPVEGGRGNVTEGLRDRARYQENKALMDAFIANLRRRSDAQ
jgi:hypothetical protein